MIQTERSFLVQSWEIQDLFGLSDFGKMRDTIKNLKFQSKNRNFVEKKFVSPLPCIFFSASWNISLLFLLIVLFLFHRGWKLKKNLRWFCFKWTSHTIFHLSWFHIIWINHFWIWFRKTFWEQQDFTQGRGWSRRPGVPGYVGTTPPGGIFACLSRRGQKCPEVSAGGLLAKCPDIFGHVPPPPGSSIWVPWSGCPSRHRGGLKASLEWGKSQGSGFDRPWEGRWVGGCYGQARG